MSSVLSGLGVSSAIGGALLISGGDAPPERIVLSQKRLVIGREATSDIILEGNTVSRKHAEMFLDPFGRWWIRDLGSRNGIYVGDRKVNEWALRPGDSVQIGDYMVVYESGQAPATASATLSTLHTSEDTGQLLSLEEVRPPNIDAAHLSLLIEFGRQLLTVESEIERAQRLCALLLRPEFGAQVAMILRSAEGEDVEVLNGPHHANGSGENPYISRRLLGSVRKTGRPALASSQASGPDVVKMSLYMPATTTSAVACPLGPTGDGPLLYATFPLARGTTEWLAIASMAAEQYRSAESAWVARHQAEMHASIEKELEQASKLQAQLVPKQLAFPGFEIDITFRPCRWVGGDYVGARAIGDGRVLFTVADVCGKGMPAALIASSLHTMLFASLRAGATLCQVMDSLNDYLCEYVGTNRFVTMVCFVLDPTNGSFEYSNAGHPPPLVLSPGKPARLLAGGYNFPLGIESEPITCREDTLYPGEVLALYSDGVSELQTPAGELLATEGLAEILAKLHSSNPRQPLPALNTMLQAKLDELQQGRLAHDDITLLLARRV
jgi:sigma-B regulation protein RsbU (phosphoserine phosphatase)